MKKTMVNAVWRSVAVIILVQAILVKGTTLTLDSNLTADTCRVLSRGINQIKFDLDEADSSILETAEICYDAILLALYANILVLDQVHIRGRLPRFIANKPQSKIRCGTLQLEGRVEDGVEISIWEEAGPVFYQYFEFVELSTVTLSQEDLVTLNRLLVEFLEEQVKQNAIYLATYGQLPDFEYSDSFSFLTEVQTLKTDRNDPEYLTEIISVLQKTSIKKLILTKLAILPDIITKELFNKEIVKFHTIDTSSDSWLAVDVRRINITQPRLPIVSNIPLGSSSIIEEELIDAQSKTHIFMEYNNGLPGTFNLNLNTVLSDWYQKAINNNNINRIRIICNNGRIDEDDVFQAIIGNTQWYTAIRAGFKEIVSFLSVDDFHEYIKRTPNLAAISTFKKPYQESSDSLDRRMGRKESALQRLARTTNSRDKKRELRKRSQSKPSQDNLGAASSAAAE